MSPRRETDGDWIPAALADLSARSLARATAAEVIVFWR
jgi:hypothetical protein